MDMPAILSVCISAVLFVLGLMWSSMLVCLSCIVLCLLAPLWSSMLVHCIGKPKQQLSLAADVFVAESLGTS